MSSGKVDIRVMQQTGKARLRFYTVHMDQMATIQQALEVARTECGTQYDTVALEMICLEFLATPVGPRRRRENLGSDGDETGYARS